MSDEEMTEDEFLELASVLWTDNGLEVTENTLLRLRQRRERLRGIAPSLQDAPMYPDGFPIAEEYQPKADRWAQNNRYRANRHMYAWDGVILGSAYIALSQTDDDTRESELLDLAAVVIGAYEASRKRRALGA
ncbi:hypothetical protein O7614_26540 [Micromonospora sp. WMMD961]|uniref:hypothetical protein n=1 Tax=Micromonospora sp. WMMD961 TaxID=3016100 RepID=UPI002417C469|nr:hypothetical protein [Micromonospora sp. WMMD961]MDG4783223.1 hypothetical protein [Micromonospora sp. WMMD961]